MEQQIKQRLVGATILLALLGLLMPWLLSHKQADYPHIQTSIPPKPEMAPVRVLMSKQVSRAQAIEARVEQDQKAMAETPADDYKVSDKATITPAWTLQVGSFNDKANAQALTEKLQAARYKAYMRTVRMDKGAQTKVYVGPELRRQDSEAILVTLKADSEFQLNGWLVTYQP